MLYHGTLEVGMNVKLGPGMPNDRIYLSELPLLEPLHASTEFQARSELSSVPCYLYLHYKTQGSAPPSQDSPEPVFLKQH